MLIVNIKAKVNGIVIIISAIEKFYDILAVSKRDRPTGSFDVFRLFCVVLAVCENEGCMRIPVVDKYVWDNRAKEKGQMKIAGCFKGNSEVLPYVRRYEIAAEDAEREKRFWAGVHKEIMQIDTAPPDVKARSREWLISNGYSTGM